MSKKSEEQKPYSFTCEKHGYTTRSPREANLHMRGDIIDGVFGLGAAVVKASLGIPKAQKSGYPFPAPAVSHYCHCWALPYPHLHQTARQPGGIKF